MWLQHLPTSENDHVVYVCLPIVAPESWRHCIAYLQSSLRQCSLACNPSYQCVPPKACPDISTMHCLMSNTNATEHTDVELCFSRNACGSISLQKRSKSSQRQHDITTMQVGVMVRQAAPAWDSAVMASHIEHLARKGIFPEGWHGAMDMYARLGMHDRHCHMLLSKVSSHLMHVYNVLKGPEIKDNNETIKKHKRNQENA